MIAGGKKKGEGEGEGRKRLYEKGGEMGEEREPM